MTGFLPPTSPPEAIYVLALTLDYSELCALHLNTRNRITTLQDYRGSTPWLPQLLINAILAGWMSTATIKVHASCKTKQSDSDMELRSVHPDSTPLLTDVASSPSSLRSSLDKDDYQSQGCDIHIYDDKPLDQGTSPDVYNRGFDASTWYGGVGSREGLRQYLQVPSIRVEWQIPGSLVPGQRSVQDSMDVCILTLVGTNAHRLMQL